MKPSSMKPSSMKPSSMKLSLMKLSSMIISLFIANSAGATLVPTTVTCLINRSVSLITELRHGPQSGNEVLLSKKHFLHEPEVIAVLNRPQIIRYDNVIMILQDNGRSGYAFLRFEKKHDGRIDGWVDINLFPDQSIVNIPGRLAKVVCTSAWLSSE